MCTEGGREGLQEACGGCGILKEGEEERKFCLCLKNTEDKLRKCSVNV